MPLPRGIDGQLKGMKYSWTAYENPRYSYLIVGEWSLAVRKRRQPVVDQGLDSGRRHAIWNPILADNQVQTAKVWKGSV